MQDPTFRRLRLTCALGLFATVLVAVGVCILFVPAGKWTGMFWLELGWAAFLMAIIWAGIYTYLCTPLRAEEARKGMGGLAPALPVCSISFAVVSLLLLGTQSVFSNNEFLSRLLLAGQLVPGAVAVVIALLLAVVRLYTEPRRSNEQQTARVDLTDKELP